MQRNVSQLREKVDISASWTSVPIGVVAAAGVASFAPVDETTATLLAITVFCIALWIATPVRPAYTGLLCIGLVGTTVSTELALTGFRSATTWLIVFGLLLGEATRASGLARLGGRWIQTASWPGAVDESVPATTAFRRLLLVLGGAGLGLAFLVPSALVRVITIAPVATELGRTFDSRRARIGVFLGPLFVTFYAAPGIFTAGLPNIITTGIAESLGEDPVRWTEWTTVMFPVSGVGRAAVVVLVVYALFRPRDERRVSVPTASVERTGDEHRMLLFLLVGVLVWTTDGLHGLHPMYGALIVVLLALLPRVGVASFEDVTAVDFSIVFFLGAVFAIGNGLAETGFAERAAESLLDVLPAGAPLWLLLLAVFGATVALSFLIEGLAVASVFTPVLVSYADRVGAPLAPVLMTESLALCTYFFPYQSAVLVTILGQDVADARTIVRTTVVTSVASIVLVLPLQIAVFVLAY